MQGQQNIATYFGEHGIFTTAFLAAYLKNLKTPSSFLLDKFFPMIIQSPTSEIDVDVDVGKRRMAKFSSPLVEGEISESRQWVTGRYKSAYIKAKRNPDLLRPIARMMGERIGGELSPQVRVAENIKIEIQDLLNMVQLRLEKMASEALLSGICRIENHEYPSQSYTVDFKRKPTLTKALMGEVAWNSGKSSPSSNITRWGLDVVRESGATPTVIVMDSRSFDFFKADPDVKLQVTQQAILMAGKDIKNADQLIELGSVGKKGAVFMGYWGQFEIWVYNEWYVEEVRVNGILREVQKPIIPLGTVIVGSKDMMGIRYFGPILDPAAGYKPEPFFPKAWVEPDPAQPILMMSSSPLIVPSRVNACMSVKVFDPSAGPMPAEITPPALKGN